MGERHGWHYVDVRIPREGSGTMKASYTEITCKYCGSTTGIVRFGKYKKRQQWWCKKCKRKFVDNAALPRMRTPVEQVGLALADFYDGGSLSAIRRKLQQQYENSPSDSSIYGWITRFSKVAIDKAKDVKPNVGDTWIADETVLNIEGKNIYFWDCMDSKTRFLLASHMSGNRTVEDAKELMEQAAKRAGKSPKIVITDKLQSYIDGIELAFGSDTEHVQSEGFATQPNTNLIERMHGSIKDRTKVMRGLKTIESAKRFMDAWTVFYNYFRTHESLKKTPAEAAGVNFPFKNWLDIAKEKEKPKELLKPISIKRHYGFEQARRHKSRKHRSRNTFQSMSEVSRTR